MEISNLEQEQARHKQKVKFLRQFFPDESEESLLATALLIEEQDLTTNRNGTRLVIARKNGLPDSTREIILQRQDLLNDLEQKMSSVIRQTEKSRLKELEAEINALENEQIDWRHRREDLRASLQQNPPEKQLSNLGSASSPWARKSW